MYPVKDGFIMGFGGIYVKSSNPDSLANWYKKTFELSNDLPNEEDNSLLTFRWSNLQTNQKGMTILSIINDKTDYFEPSKENFMINFIVNNLDKMVEHLINLDVKIVDGIQKFAYGKIIHLLDPEGNKIELWEPNDLANA